jgi:hypothetical protein
MDSAGSAEPLAAAVFCAGKLQVLPDDPEKRQIRAYVQLMLFSVDLQRYHEYPPVLEKLEKMHFRIDSSLPKKMLPHEQVTVNFVIAGTRDCKKDS